ncbi:hypothetical protein MY11210_003030 [Beauveria gryllotalpidicola]
MKSDKKKGAPAPSRIADARFSSFETDPRFRLPSKKNAKTRLDKRFSGMLDDEDFTSTSHVDRYGRKVKSDSKKKALQRLYEAGGDKAEEGEKEGSEAEIEVDDDDAVQRELRAVHERDLRANYDPARGGGFSSSEEEDSSEEEGSDDDSDDGGAELVTEGDMQRLQDEQAEVEAGEVSKRIAIVNLDWDHVNSTNLFALFTSFIGETSGRVVKVSVYPSEFGKERMQREEIEGPPKELFKENKDDSDSDEEEDSDEEDERIKKKLMQEGDDQDFDSDALRKYQLDRLRYYYAIMECSDEKIAQKLYEATDGTEYQSSSNFLDLRFVPDDVEFDDEPRDECTKLPDSYKPVEFVTTALQSSKVKLTWDLHPEEATRKDSIKRAFTGSRADLEENDLRAYLASDTEGSDDDDDDGHKVATFGGEDDNDDDSDDDDPAGQVAEETPKLSKQERARQKMRAALGLGEKPAPKAAKGGPVGEMQITFTPALSEAKATKSAEDEEETTIERYKRKERERKERKREAARARRAGANGETAAAGGDDDESGATMTFNSNDDGREDLGFDDPFFTSEAPAAASKSSIRKAERLQKREARLAADAADAEERAHLSKVMAEDDAEGGAAAAHLDHFDMKEILRAEKQQQRKKAKAKGKAKTAAAAAAAGAALQGDFAMDVGDARFQAVFDNHEYAIDPSHPKFTASAGMKQVLEEGRRKRRAADWSAGREDTRKSKKTKSRR